MNSRSLLLTILTGIAAAESGIDGWLRYSPLSSGVSGNYKAPSRVISLNDSSSSPVNTAGLELQKGIQGILGQKVDISHDGSDSSSIVVGTVAQFTKAYGTLPTTPKLEEDGFWLSTQSQGNGVQIVGQNERGALYGAFEYLSMLAMGNFSQVSYATNPNQPVRWINQWDNLDGSIERGYGGSSLFFQGGSIKRSLDRLTQYARLLASIRVNGIIINNVNANPSLLSSSNIDGLGRVGDALRPYGVRVGISLKFDSPQQAGGLRTSDPLDSSVIDYWAKTTDKIYQKVPDFAGYLVKANSEGQPGPLTYSRTLAQGANLFARALKPHGGIVMFRAFVYNQLQYSDRKADRANAAVEFFNGLDGNFDDNVVIQIKYGPIDFQVREPVSPLFGRLLQTSSAVELQVSQEYFGQQCHLVYLPTLWKTILDFDLRVESKPSLVRDILAGRRFNRPGRLGGSAAVVNVGTHNTWLGSHMAMSNLYAYGRLAWDPTADIVETLHDWTRLTFGLDPTVLDVIEKISIPSWQAYENYTGNLGVQSLTDILYTHYGPNPASQDNNGWGQWIRADRNGVGMDRSKNGTGNAGQYPPEISKMYENLDTTPDELLLWFHHVPYTYKLKSGKTVIQHFYDAHYAGAKTAQEFVTAWESLKGKLDDERYKDILFHLSYQAGHAVVWRDTINRYFHDLSRVEDEKHRVGNKTYRIEAEDMTLKNYRAAAANPTVTASGGKGITASGGDGTAQAKLDFADGLYDISVGYFDVNGGKAHWEAYHNDDKLGEWVGENEDRLFHEASDRLDGHTGARITFRGVQIKKGDSLRLVGKPNGREAAPLDYVDVIPQGVDM